MITLKRPIEKQMGLLQRILVISKLTLRCEGIAENGIPRQLKSVLGGLRE